MFQSIQEGCQRSSEAGPLKKSPAPQIMRYMLQLLQTAPAGRTTPQEDNAETDTADSAAQQSTGYATHCIALRYAALAVPQEPSKAAGMQHIA